MYSKRNARIEAGFSRSAASYEGVVRVGILEPEIGGYGYIVGRYKNGRIYAGVFGIPVGRYSLGESAGTASIVYKIYG